MTLREVVEELALDVKCCDDRLETSITFGYASDLLSDVLANSDEGALWVTLQTHPNTAAIASMKGLSGIVLVNSRQPETETVSKAAEEGIPVMVSDLPAFELIARLAAMGVPGTKDES